MEYVDISIIIAHKNRFRNIEYCVSSLITCKPKAKTIIVVDFDSPKEIITMLLKYPTCKVVSVRNDANNFNKARGLNIGIRAAKTKYILTTDADQIFSSGFIGCVYNTLIANKNSFVMCGTYRALAIPEWFTIDNIHKKYQDLLDLIKIKEPRPSGNGCCHATTTKWFMEVHGYEETFHGWGGQDCDLSIRALRSKRHICNIQNKTSMIHLPHTIDKTYKVYTILNRNRLLYKSRKKAHVIIANRDCPWGVL